MSSAFSKLKLIGEIRDGLLVGSGLLYGLGYLVWSLRALVENLGLLPLVESQYFMAGILPALILGLAYWAFTGLRRLVDRLPDWIGPDVKGRRLFWRGVTIFSFWGAFAAFIASISSDVIQKTFPDWRLAPFHFIAIMAIGSLLWAGSEKNSERFMKWVALFYLYFLSYGVASLIASVYIGVVHPSIPQELGGSRPRCAYLDLAKSKLSEKTLRDIIPSDAIDSDRAVVRSIQLSIFFSGKEFMLVKPSTSPPGGERAKPPAYELRQGAIEAIQWCG